MKNIYQDNFTEDSSRDVFSHSSKEKAEITSSESLKKPVRSAKQAPPPIKKSVIANKNSADSVTPDSSEQPGFYPQPVFYPPAQPYPVYYPPVPGYPYAPGTYPQSAGSESAVTNDAGTRVLFQSEDFDRKEEIGKDDFYGDSYSDNISYDVSEINLPSKNATSNANKKTDFNVDEMEIGTYEFNIMTAGQTSKAKSILTPDEEKKLSGLTEENLIDEIIEDDESEIKETSVPHKTSVKKPVLPTSEIIRRIIIAVSVVTMIVSAGFLVNEYRLHRENKNLMNDLSDLIITQAPTETTKKNNKKPATTVPNTLPLAERPLSEQEQWESIKSENPNIVFPERLQLKYAKLYAQNPDFVGYIYAEGSELDSPVVQGEDDEEYIEKNFYGEYTKYACPFLSARNSLEPFDDNTIIYGHHMRDGSIFGTLAQYRTLEGYKKAPVISFNTIYQDFDFKIIATMITNIDPKHDNGYVFTYYWTNLNNVLNHTAYLNQLSQRSLYDTGVDVLPSDKLLTLSTCCKDFDDARLVVVARLVRPGESSEVDTSRAVENKNPRFPQAYYDELGKENPYANAYQWEIS